MNLLSLVEGLQVLEAIVKVLGAEVLEPVEAESEDAGFCSKSITCLRLSKTWLFVSAAIEHLIFEQTIQILQQ